MQIATAIAIHAYGTSEGADKAWDTRGRGRKERPHVPKLDRSKLAKQSYVKVTADKIQMAAQSVKTLASVLGSTPTSDSHPWDILLKGTKIGVEVKRFMPGRTHLKATIHSGTGDVKDKNGSKERKVEFADKHGMKRMYLVVHDTHDPSKEMWYVRRVGDKGDPRSDPKDARTGWSYNARTMTPASSPEKVKELLK